MAQSNITQTFLIIDFEATCSNDKKEVPKEEMEIIEFAGILIDSNYNLLWEFTEFIKPIRHPVLTKFCTELTTITQHDVDHARLFPDVLQSFITAIPDKKPLFLSWGNFDKYQLQQDCALHDVEYPFQQNNHFNIKLKVNEFLEFKKHKGISEVLLFLKLQFEGTPHRGIDDVKNIRRILQYIIYPLKDLEPRL